MCLWSHTFDGVWLEIVKNKFVPVLQCRNLRPEICFCFESVIPNTETAQHRGDFSPHQTFKGSGETPKWENAWNDFCASQFGVVVWKVAVLPFILIFLYSHSHIFFKHRTPADTNILMKKLYFPWTIWENHCPFWCDVISNSWFSSCCCVFLFSRVVKEEISDDNAKLPCFNGRVVSWVCWILCV